MLNPSRLLIHAGLICAVVILGYTPSIISGEEPIPGHMQAPDLTLDPWDISFSDDTPAANQTITIWARVHNVGDSLVYNVPVYFYNNTTNIGVSVLSLVEPNIPRSTYILWTPMYAGVVNITVVIDPLNIINESNENNNAAWRDILVSEPLLPDLQVMDISFSDDQPKHGESVTVRASIFNAGRVDAKDVIVAFIDNNTVFSYEILSFIGPNQTSNISTIWIAKSDIGNITTPRVIGVFADPEDNIPEISEGNNLRSEVIFVGRPRLAELSIVPEDIYFSTPHPLGNETITIYAKVRNLGETRADNVPVAFYSNSRWIGTHILDSVPGQLSSTASIQWTPPAGFTTLTVIIDPAGVIPEYDKTNNIANKTIIVDRYLPQISFANLSCSASRVIENMTVTLYADVLNTGQDAAFNLIVRFYDVSEDRKEIGWYYLDKVSPGMKRHAFIRWVAAPPGNHTILAEADAEYSAGELNATHAETNTTVYVWPALPDLEALSISIYPYPASEGVQTRVNATIRNHGVIEAQDVNVVLIDNEGVVAGAVITIPADPTGSTRMNITFNYTSVAGVHLLTIFLDPKNNIPEYNETDNSVSLRIEVPEKPGGINLAAISLIAIILLMLFIITYIWREKILSLMIAMIIWVLILVINIPLLRRMVDEVYRGMKGGGYTAAQMIVKKGQ